MDEPKNINKWLEPIIERAMQLQPQDTRSSARRLQAVIAEDLSRIARDKAEQTARENSMVEALQAIRRELECERNERARLADLVKQHEAELARYRTGVPGRPGSRHLVLEEFRKRAAASSLEGTLAGEARAIVAWLHANHPNAHPLTQKSAENLLREEYRAARQSLRPNS